MNAPKGQSQENILMNVYELSYVTALKLHSLLSSFYNFQHPMPKNSYLKFLILKIAAKIQRNYRYKIQKVHFELIGKTVKWAFFVVFKQKFAEFYKDLKVPKVKKEDLPVEILSKCIQNRQTYKIQSGPFQKLPRKNGK